MKLAENIVPVLLWRLYVFDEISWKPELARSFVRPKFYTVSALDTDALALIWMMRINMLFERLICES